MTGPRILYIINSVEGGGAALPVPSVIGVLQRGGAEVRVLALTRRDGRALASMAAAGLDVRVRDGGETDHFAAWRWLDAQVRDWRPTHLWTSLTRATLLGQLVGLRRRVPVVSWQHAAFLRPTNRRLLRATQRLSRLWIGDSESVTRLTAARLLVPKERLVTWPIFRADPDAPRAVPWQAGKPLRLGSLGRLHPVKGYDVLVEALALLRSDVPFEVTIAGDGAARAALQAQAEAAGVTNLRLGGYADDPRAFLAGLHLYLQPSRSEGLCVAAHEAMQAGLPVIASAVGELPFSIEQEVTGWTVPPADASALAAVLDAALARRKALAAMGDAARQRVLSRFGPDHFEATGLAILDRLKTL
ncbi:glycosyltransferase family 4 protein [Glacieibacterium sp.]|uniref:glycosyltransferase family 4 protein n=1 Tax=Glacieibacterium sp. TaxID=2860237 RepID=UPI003AFFA249